jgi:hypothetical protein
MLYCTRGSGQRLRLRHIREDIHMKFLSEIMKGGNHLGDLDVDLRIKLKKLNSVAFSPQANYTD